MEEMYRLHINSYPSESHPEAPYYWCIKAFDGEDDWWIVRSGHAKTIRQAVKTATDLFLTLACEVEEDS